jgi:hypothetical protein
MRRRRESAVKIILVGLPPMLRGLVEAAVAEQPDIEIVGEVDDPSGLDEVIARTGARAVVAADDALDETRALGLVGAAHIRIVSSSGDGRRACVYECRPQREKVGELGPDTLVRLLG